MDFKKVLWSGVKFIGIALMGVIVASLTLALGFNPEGALQTVLFNYLVAPVLGAIIAMLNNYRKHINS